MCVFGEPNQKAISKSFLTSHTSRNEILPFHPVLTKLFNDMTHTPLMEEQGEFKLRQRLALALWDLPGNGSVKRRQQKPRMRREDA